MTDLLGPSQNLQLKENARGEVEAVGATRVAVASRADVDALLTRATAARTSGVFSVASRYDS